MLCGPLGTGIGGGDAVPCETTAPNDLFSNSRWGWRDDFAVCSDVWAVGAALWVGRFYRMWLCYRSVRPKVRRPHSDIGLSLTLRD